MTLQFLVTLVEYLPSLFVLITISFQFHNQNDDSYSIRKETIINCIIGIISCLLFAILQLLLYSILFEINSIHFISKICIFLMNNDLFDYFIFIYILFYCMIVFVHFMIITAWVLLKKEKFEKLSHILFNQNNNDNSNNNNNIIAAKQQRRKKFNPFGNQKVESPNATKKIVVKIASNTDSNQNCGNTIDGGFFSLKEILSDETGFQLFAAFCVSEFSVESLLFLFHLSQIKYLLLRYKLSTLYVLYCFFCIRMYLFCGIVRRNVVADSVV